MQAGKPKRKLVKSPQKANLLAKTLNLPPKYFLKKGGEIERFLQNTALSNDEVFQANLEADSRLGMGTLVDDSWDCWENKDYDTNPSG